MLKVLWVGFEEDNTEKRMMGKGKGKGVLDQERVKVKRVVAEGECSWVSLEEDNNGAHG